MLHNLKRQTKNPRMVGRCECCGRIFRKTTYSARFCDHPVCQEERDEKRKEKARIYIRKRRSIGVNHESLLLNRNRPKRRCRADEILGYRSEECDGWIHNGNIQICQHCQEMRDRRASGYMFEAYNELVSRKVYDWRYEGI